MDENLKKAISEAQAAFQQRLQSVSMEYKPLALQSQMANELIAIRVILEHATSDPAKKS